MKQILTIVFFFILGVLGGYGLGSILNCMEQPLVQQRQVWLDKWCNVHINKGVKYDQIECKKEMKK